MKKLFLTLFLLVSVIGLQAEVITTPHVVADEGAWCWFADPRAIHYRNDAGTIDASYVGYIDVHGNIKATQYDYLTGRKSDVLIRSAFQPDDHDNPTFLVLPDERIFIIYSRHTDEACFYYRISTKPGDITSLGTEHRLATANNTTYPSPFILSDDPTHIYLCWRGIGWHPTIAKLSMPDENDEVKFVYGPYQMVQSTGARPYAKYYSNGKDKLYFTYTTGHPDNEDPNWLYFNVVNINGADGPQLEDISGQKLQVIKNGKFNVNKTDSYKSSYPKTVVDATSGKRDWVWQLTCDEEKRPIIAMVKISSDKNTHDYYYAHWDGTTWQKTFLANGGGRFHTSNTEYCYSGGMAIDPDDHHEVYLSCPTNGAYEIWHYTMDDNNQIVAKEQVTGYGKPNDAAALTGGNVRPFILPGSTGKPMRLMWMNGYYQYWIVKQGYALGYPTAIHSEGAWNEETNADAPTWQRIESGRFTEALELPLGNSFTVMFHVSLDGNPYGGDLFSCNGLTYSIDPVDKVGCVKVGENVYKSSNKYYTSDNFATNSTGTASDWWNTNIASSWITITYKGVGTRAANTGVMTVYRDGLIDQCFKPVQKTTSNGSVLLTVWNPKSSETELSDAGDGARLLPFAGILGHAYVWDTDLTPVQIQQQIIAKQMDLLGASVPAKAVTDIVLPAKLGSQSIEWTSSNPDVLSATGLVNLPKQETDVVLTAKVGDQTRDYTVTVMPRNLEQNIRATLDKVDMTRNTATGFSTNTYGQLPEGVLKDVRSYTVMLKANAKSLNGQPRLYDLGGGSGNSVFLRAKALSAGIKLNGGTTTMVNSTVELKTNQDYCLAVTFDAATKETVIYIDGQEVAKGTANQNEPYMVYDAAGDARNYVGRTQWWDGQYKNDNQDFIGTISDLVVYDIALTQKEVCAQQGISFQEKEYQTALTNGDFEAAYTVKSGSGVSNDRAIYVPEGWTVDYATRNENDFSALKDGDLYYGQFFASKAQPADAGRQTYWVRQRWGSSVITLYQELRLPAGKYTFSADAFCSDTSGKSYVFIGKRQLAPAKAGEWQTLTAELEADGEEVLRIGLSTSHADSDGERICAFDNFLLTPVIEDGIEQLTIGQLPNGKSSNSKCFDLQGRPATPRARSIYIKEGKKVIR